MGSYKDLTGMKFGKLTVIKRVNDHIEPSGRHVAMWECKCDCGTEHFIAVGKRLKGGITKSCGCLQKEHPNGTTHGMSHTHIYKIWNGMKRRCNCTDVSSLSYKNYHSRGITVCEEWQDNFQAFYDWAMANGYREGLTLDRIDNDKGYSPDNCRWADNKTQCNNRRNNHLITYNGKTQTLTQWAEELNIRPATLWARIFECHWTTEKALKTPVQKYKIKRAV